MSGDVATPICAPPTGDQGSDQVSSSNEGLLDRDEDTPEIKVKAEPEVEDTPGTYPEKQKMVTICHNYHTVLFNTSLAIKILLIQ